jgi:hypothetical protein
LLYCVVSVFWISEFLFYLSDTTSVLSLIETAKLNGLDPEAYLRTMLTRIADHPIKRIGDLLPWSLAGGGTGRGRTVGFTRAICTLRYK